MAANEIQVVLPELAESVVEGEILQWHVAEGDTVERDAPLLDVASDKANVELPSPYAGTVVRLLAAVGDVVAVDAPIAVIRLDDDAGDAAASKSAAAEIAIPDADSPGNPEEKAEPEADVGAEIQIVLPELAESVVEGEVLQWHVAEGDTIERDAPLLDVASDKANVELPSAHSGTIVRQLVAVGDVVAVGAPIAVIRVSAAGTAARTNTAKAGAADDDDDDGDDRSLFSADRETRAVHNPFAGSNENKADKQAVTEQPQAGTNRYGRVLAVPSARILARELGVDIATVPGSGANGRVRRDDVRAFAEQPEQPAMQSPTAPAAAGQVELPPPVTYNTPAGYADREERVPLRGMRRAIARQMSASHLYAVRTLVVDEADMSRLVSLRKQLKPGAQAKGVKLSYLPFIFKALVWALQDYPQLNTSLDEATREIVYKTYYNIGLAVATEAGLVVPVVRDADAKTILELGSDINHYAERARDGKLAPGEMQGASFSVTNVGPIGSLFSFPIINSPDAAILGVHAIKDRPIALDGEVVIRPMIYLSLSFDHRLVDGAMAAQFLRNIIERLEAPEQWLLAAV